MRKNVKLTTNQSIIAGSVAGLVSGFSFQPLEVLRTRAIGTKGVNSIVIAKQIISSDGFAGLWRGTVASLYRQVPGIAWFYAVIEKMSPKTSSDRIAAGFIARSSATTVFLPLVVIKTQIEWGNGSSIADVARRIHKSEGISGFWRGLFPTLLRDGPYSALYVLFYKSMQDSFGSERASVNFLLGILAGASAVILTQPADVLRCHLQIDQRIGLENFKSHIRERGILRALYLDGIGPRITRRTLVSAINWTIFEELKKRL
ncbi:unnamed protein product [Oikopleura dioica]|uniref:Solute carrier family 25 member 38 n=1 Tax=Oikopleura dioica TaxID=34765 RepID=E4X371_OIKDI|nr:unnamed protein product [Oikopleura dioica]